MSCTINFSGEQNRALQIGYNSGTIQFARATDARRPPDPKTFWNIPFRRNPDFVDHGNVLPLIADAMDRPSARFALTGLGGIGKSQFVIEFAYRCRESLFNNGPPAFCFWVDASSQFRFENSFMDIAVQLGLVRRGLEGSERQRDILQNMKDWLVDERNGNWILVVDNADDYSVLFAPDTEGGGTEETKRSLAHFLPQSPNGKVLVTSRYKKLAHKLVGNRPSDVFEVHPMPRPQALDLMRRKLSVDQSNEASALELLKVLNFIPLAITQASAYINQRRPFTSILKYLEGLRENGPAANRLLEHDAGGIDFGSAGSRSILSTTKLSWDLIRNLRPTAVRLLSLMAFFNCQAIQTFLLHRYRYHYAYDCAIRHYGRLRDITIGDSAEIEFSFHYDHAQVSLDSAANFQSSARDRSPHVHCKHPISNDEKEFEEDIHFLQDFSLVSTSTDGSAIQMHSLVRAAIRAWLKSLEEDKKWEHLSFQVLAEEFPLHTELEPLSVCEQLMTHVELDAEPPPYGDAFKDWAQIIVAVGSHASDRKDNFLLRKTNEIALQFVDTHGHEAFHKEVAFPLTAGLAFQLAELDDCAAAEKLLNSLENDRKSLPAHHPDLYTDLRARSCFLLVSGRHNEAEALDRKAFNTWRSIDGENGVRTMVVKHDLGTSHFQNGRYEEAKKILSSLKGPYEEFFGEKNPCTLSANLGLARALQKVAELEAAESLYQKILDIYDEGSSVAPIHEIVSANQMAIIRLSQGRYDEAEIFSRRALRRYEDMYGGSGKRAECFKKSLENVLRLKAKRKDTVGLPRN